MTSFKRKSLQQSLQLISSAHYRSSKSLKQNEAIRFKAEIKFQVTLHFILQEDQNIGFHRCIGNDSSLETLKKISIDKKQEENPKLSNGLMNLVEFVSVRSKQKMVLYDLT